MISFKNYLEAKAPILTPPTIPRGTRSSTNLNLYYAKQGQISKPIETLYTYFIPKKVSENNNQTYNLYPVNPLGNTDSFIVSKLVTNGLIVYFSKTNDVKEWVVNDLGIQN